MRLSPAKATEFITERVNMDHKLIMRFLNYVEIRTKLASILPFIFGVLFGVWKNGEIIWANTILMAVSLLFIDMATTAINNHLDAYSQERDLAKRRALRWGFSDAHGLIIILILLSVAGVTGFILFLRTDTVVLLVGAIAFVVGICYTAGPIPISRTPFGEILSGVFMGGIIPFLAAYINTTKGYLIHIGLHSGVLTVTLDLWASFQFALAVMPYILFIAAIMLANNICDLDHDQSLGRCTLVKYIGISWGIRLWRSLYELGFLAVGIAVGIHGLPIWSLGTLAVLPLVILNMKRFSQVQDKRKTFVLSVKNLLIMGLVSCGSMCIAIFFH